MILADKDSLYSAVKNTSGRELVCSWLPGHGGTLANGETRYVFGNVLDVIGRRGRRTQKSFAKLIDQGKITITQLPAPLVKDTATGLTKSIKVTNGTLSVVDPGFYASDSLSDDANKVITPRGRDDRAGPPA